jgi:ketosteroid isomerase-like protein
MRPPYQLCANPPQLRTTHTRRQRVFWRSHPDEVRELSAVILAMFPSGLRFETEAMTTEGERIAAQASGRGEHVNVRLYSNTYHRLFVIRDGKIQILKEYMDTAIAGELLGHEGPPKASARRAPRLKDPAGLFFCDSFPPGATHLRGELAS